MLQRLCWQTQICHPIKWLLVATPETTPRALAVFGSYLEVGPRRLMIIRLIVSNPINRCQRASVLPVGASGRCSRCSRRSRSSTPRPKHLPDPEHGCCTSAPQQIGFHKLHKCLPMASVSTRRCHTPISTLLPQPGDSPPLQMLTKRCSPTAPKRTTGWRRTGIFGVIGLKSRC